MLLYLFAHHPQRGFSPNQPSQEKVHLAPRLMLSACRRSRARAVLLANASLKPRLFTTAFQVRSQLSEDAIDSEQSFDRPKWTAEQSDLLKQPFLLNYKISRAHPLPVCIKCSADLHVKVKQVGSRGQKARTMRSRDAHQENYTKTYRRAG